MLTQLKRLAAAGMFLLPLGAAALHAQSPTPEGTTITNTATASFTDINNNTYTAVTGSVSVKVGFLAAPNPGGQASYTPASPSTGNVAAFTIKNSGNGIDSATVSVSAPGVSITGYSYNGTSYTTLAALNAVIKLVSLTAGSSLPFPVNVIYTVDGSSGGATLPITLTQLSVRTPAVTANWVTNVMPPAVPGVSVTPKAGTIAKVPTNGAPAYTQSFTVTNTGNASNTFAIAASIGLPNNSTVTITGVSASSVPLAAGANTSVTVTYTVANGTSDQILLKASGGGVNDTGDMTVTVSKASLSLAKSAWTAMSGGVAITNTTADAIVPGTVFYYKLAVTNAAGSADAKSVVISDPLPATLTYVSAAGDIPADWSISQSSGTVTATLTPVVTAGTTRFIWVGVKITP